MSKISNFGMREVIFKHENGKTVSSIIPQHDEQMVKMMPGADGLEIIETPVFVSHNGDWTIEEIEALSQVVVFKEKGKVKTSYGKESFKDEQLAVYDTIGGMIKFGKYVGINELNLAKSIFGKIFPKLSFDAVYHYQLN